MQQDHAEDGMAEQPMGLPPQGMAVISPKSPACDRCAARRGAAGLNRLITG
jgi:hypothetical protein